jgi:hypothetical protein
MLTLPMSIESLTVELILSNLYGNSCIDLIKCFINFHCTYLQNNVKFRECIRAVTHFSRKSQNTDSRSVDLPVSF